MLVSTRAWILCSALITKHCDKNMNKKQFEKLLLETAVDSFNAGRGKKVRRVFFCKKAGEYVVQEKTSDGWLCLHNEK